MSRVLKNVSPKMSSTDFEIPAISCGQFFAVEVVQPFLVRHQPLGLQAKHDVLLCVGVERMRGVNIGPGKGVEHRAVAVVGFGHFGLTERRQLGHQHAVAMRPAFVEQRAEVAQLGALVNAVQLAARLGRQATKIPREVIPIAVGLHLWVVWCRGVGCGRCGSAIGGVFRLRIAIALAGN